MLAVNKIDRLVPAAIGASIERIAELGDFAALVPVSARTADGVDRIRRRAARVRARRGPALYPVDATSGDPVRLRIGELVREAALNRTREEVPHAVAVLVDELRAARRGGRRRASPARSSATTSRRRGSWSARAAR